MYYYIRCIDKDVTQDNFSVYTKQESYIQKYLNQFYMFEFLLCEYDCDSEKEFVNLVYKDWKHSIFPSEDEIYQNTSFDGKVELYLSSNQITLLVYEGQLWDDVAETFGKAVLTLISLYTYIKYNDNMNHIIENLYRYMILVGSVIVGAIDDEMNEEIALKFNIDSVYDILDETKLLKWSLINSGCCESE